MRISKGKSSIKSSAEQQHERNARYYREHAEQEKARNRAWRQANRARTKKYRRAKYKKERDSILASRRLARSLNPSKMRGKDRRDRASYRGRHKERLADEQRAYYVAHRDERLAYAKNYFANKVAECRAAVYKAYGDKCACCGETTPEFLCIDHINGGGSTHRRAIGGGNQLTYYRWIISHGFPKTLRLLCQNCNASMGHYGYCPHARD